MPRWVAILATFTPMAPRPTTPRRLARRAPGRQIGSSPFPPACRWRRPRPSAFWPTRCLWRPCGRPAAAPPSTSSFTALALAPGVLNTTMPCLAAFVHRDIVDACARPCNGQQAVRQLHIVHGGAAHQNAVGLRALLIHGKQIAGKALQPLGRNIVQCFDIVHFRFPLFRLCVRRYPPRTAS